MINNLEAINLQEREQRRQLLLRITTIVIAMAAILGIVITALFARNAIWFWLFISGISGTVIFSAIANGLARLGYLALAPHMLFIVLDLMFVVALLRIDTPPGMEMILLSFSIVGAALLLGPRWTFGYAALAVAVHAILFVIADSNKPIPNFWVGLVYSVMFSGVSFGGLALLTFITAQRQERLLNSSMIYARDLENARGNLEQRVAERTSEIEQALADLQRSHTTIEQLNVPLLPIAEGVLMLPLVGAIDTQRANSITQQVLETVHRQHAHTVLLDVTAIAMIDTYVARMVLDLTQSIRLLGAEAVLVGVQAATAQTLIDLGVHVAGLVVHRDVRSGLAYALHRTPNQMLTM